MSTSAYDRDIQQQLRESQLSSEDVDRKWKEEQILSSQAKSKLSAAEYEARQKQMREFNAGFAPPPPGASAAAGMPQMEPQTVSGNMGPDGPAAGTGVPGAAGGSPTMPPPSAPAPGGMAPSGSPFYKFLGEQPGLRTAYGNAIASGDSETQRKIMSMYDSSVGGTKDQRAAESKKYAESLADGSWTPDKGGFYQYQVALKQAGASSVTMINKAEGSYGVGLGTEAAKVRGAYAQQGRDATDAKRQYGAMYTNVLETKGTGAIANLKLGMRKMARAIGWGEEFTASITGIEDHEIARWEVIRVQTMQQVFKYIEKTKGAISEREMAAFEKASPGMENTRIGNVVIIEMAMALEEGKIARSKYIKIHTPLDAGPEAVERAERGWLAYLNDGERDVKRTEELNTRMRAITNTHEDKLTALMKAPRVKANQRAFYESTGWLPRGMKVNPAWKVR
jgi:hypothetical protein